AEDRALEILELGTRLDPELLDEQPAAGAVGGERLGLPAGAVERDHELPAELLAQRLLLDERLELGDEPLVPAELELGLDPRLEGAEPELGQPPSRRPRERLAAELRDARPPPERERLGEELRPAHRVARR